MTCEPATPADLAAATEQLRRPVRGVAGVAHRCGCGLPDVLMTSPRLPDGTAFPTLYYLTCPRACSAVGGLESRGVMAEMGRGLAEDPELRESYRLAHLAYLSQRERLGHVPEIAGISAGGMPDRVKCLHALVAHSLAGGPGCNPLGDLALTMLAAVGADPRTGWGGPGPCVQACA